MAATAHDLVVRAGRWPTERERARPADVAVNGGRIAEVGEVRGRGREIDADGVLVTPGFVDIHTHYDGQAVWDGRLAPLAWRDHGGHGQLRRRFRAGAARAHDRLIELMEGVEDIPGAVLHEGLGWEWESFGEYLDVVERGRVTSTSPRSSRTARCASTSWASGPPPSRRRRRTTLP